jgi:hypothetical protein
MFNKLDLSPLPEQKDDYSGFEETEVLWGRILGLAGGSLLVCSAAIYAFFSWQAPTDTHLQNSLNALAESTESVPVVASVQVQKSSNIERDQLVSRTGKPYRHDESAETLDLVTNANTATAVDELASPISFRHPGLVVAELSSALGRNGQPTDRLSARVLMHNESLIKVVFYTQMQDLKGETLYHEWYRGEKRYARVRIPVQSAQQSSYSSKYIDQYMTGDWQVKILNEQGELFADARFAVVNATPNELVTAPKG